jgi:broad specificity phosphatase PhoE
VQPKTWYLVRHGETEWNASSRMQGQLDSRLTPLGRAHALNSARLLARLGVDTAFASPLGRVRETVAIIQTEMPIGVTYDDRLKEWSAGDWSGELHAEIPRKWPIEWAAWDADRYGNRSPGGESFADLTARAESFLADASTASGARVAIIAHGFLNRAIAGVLLALPPSETLAIRQSNDTVVRVVAGRATAEVAYFTGGLGPFPGLPSETTDQSYLSPARSGGGP